MDISHAMNGDVLHTDAEISEKGEIKEGNQGRGLRRPFESYINDKGLVGTTRDGMVRVDDRL